MILLNEALVEREQYYAVLLKRFQVHCVKIGV